jgi:hypothetical protein
MKWLITTGLASGIALAAAAAFAAPVAPEPAPPAQQAAPPDKIAPPMQLPPKTLKPETSGEASKELSPGHGQNAQQNTQTSPVPSSPNDAAKCANPAKQERTDESSRCP